MKRNPRGSKKTAKELDTSDQLLRRIEKQDLGLSKIIQDLTTTDAVKCLQSGTAWQRE